MAEELLGPLKPPNPHSRVQADAKVDVERLGVPVDMRDSGFTGSKTKEFMFLSQWCAAWRGAGTWGSEALRLAGGRCVRAACEGWAPRHCNFSLRGCRASGTRPAPGRPH